MYVCINAYVYMTYIWHALDIWIYIYELANYGIHEITTQCYDVNKLGIEGARASTAKRPLPVH